MAYSTYPGAASGQSAGGQYAGFDGGATWIDGVSTQIFFVPMTSGTGSAQIPVGVTAQRDTVPITGSLRYNSETAHFEGYNGSAWVEALDINAVIKTSQTGSAGLPYGTTAQRDVAPPIGSIRYNTTTGRPEIYSGTLWIAIAGAGGGDGDFFVFENDIQVDVDYTLTEGKNGMSAGPITIAPGVTVTVPVGSTYTIV
jgi:hypothetical protein